MLQALCVPQRRAVKSSHTWLDPFHVGFPGFTLFNSVGPNQHTSNKRTNRPSSLKLWNKDNHWGFETFWELSNAIECFKQHEFETFVDSKTHTHRGHSYRKAIFCYYELPNENDPICIQAITRTTREVFYVSDRLRSEIAEKFLEPRFKIIFHRRLFCQYLQGLSFLPTRLGANKFIRWLRMSK